MNYFILTILLTSAMASVSAKNNSTVNLQMYEKQKAQLENTLNRKNRGGSVVTVGDTNDCDFRLGATKIQDAIDFGADEVRVAEGTYNENIIIDDIDLILKGGYATCADAAADNQIADSLDTIIDALSATPTIQVLGDTQRNTVTIDHVRITGGTGSGFATGGGIAALVADTSLNLSYVYIIDNTGILGGGISMVAGDTDIVANNLMVIGNTAPEGGGIFCNGNNGTNSVLIFGDDDNQFGIAANQATDGSGGGVYLNDGCVFTSFVGTSGSSLDFRGIFANTATEHGGGIYAVDGSEVNLVGSEECAFIFCFGYDSQPVNVTGNVADSDNTDGGDGGGIYAIGADTVVNVNNGLIANNKATNGAGVLVTDTATFFTNSTYKKNINCWSPGSCNQITENLAAASGGAVRAETGGTAQVHGTHVQGNRANFGTAFYSIFTNSSIVSEGSLFTNNGDDGSDGYSDFNVFRLLNDGNIELSYATIADNNIPSTNQIINNNTSTIRLVSSIVHETNAVPVYATSGPATDTFDCLIVHEDSSFTTDFNVAVDDPEFIDRANDDYHINWMISPAIDFCDAGFSPPAYPDTDNQQRGWDWPGISNNVGSFDVGFDEQNDVIFADDLENLG